MLRVLLTNFHPGDGGGHTTYIKALLTSTHPEIKVHVAVPETSKIYQFAKSNGFEPFAVDFPGKLRELKAVISNCIRLRKILASQRFHIIHCNGSPDHRLVLYTLFLIRRANRPRVVFTKHNSFAIKNNFLTRLRYAVYTDHLIVVCTKLQPQFSNLGIPSNGITVIENGVDTAQFRKRHSQRSLSDLRTRLGLPNSGTLCVSCAGSGLHKGWQYMAEAAKDFPNVYVVVLGTEPDERRLQDLFGGIQPPNLIFPGNQSDVRPYLWAANVGFVLSTAVETISFACREMMAAGLPMIVSDFGCLPENISDETGWVTKAGNVNSVREALTKALDADLSAMSVAAQNRANARFKLSQFQSATLNVYKEVAK